MSEEIDAVPAVEVSQEGVSKEDPESSEDQLQVKEELENSHEAILDENPLPNDPTHSEDTEAEIETDEFNIFLTTANMENNEKIRYKNNILFTTTSHGKEIYTQYQGLMSLCQELHQHIDNVTIHQENTFLLSYKDHMRTILKEFAILKKKADEEETKVRTNALIVSLESDLNKYMQEAMQLNTLSTQYKKELNKWKLVAQNLQSDIGFLSDQLKAAKRQNKILSSVVEKNNERILQHNLVLEDVQGHLGGEQSSSRPLALENGDKQKKKTRTPALPSLNGSNNGHARDGDGDGEDEGVRKEYTREDLNAVEKKHEETIRKLRNELQKEKKLVRSLRTNQSNLYCERTEMESFFLQCVQQVKKDILKRRDVTKGKAYTVDNASSDPLAQPNIFSSNDKKKVIELLLSSEEVLLYLYECLFSKEGVKMNNQPSHDMSTTYEGAFEHNKGISLPSGESYEPSKNLDYSIA